MINLIKLATAGMFAFLMTANGANASVIINGDAETGDLTGWTCINADSCHADTGSLTANSGRWYFEGYDNNGQDAKLSQTFATVIGELYDLAFFSTASQLSASNILHYGITGYTDTLVATTLDWLQTTRTFTATAASTELSFMFETVGGTGIFGIDDITVTRSVPEPAPLALLGFGLLGFGLMRKRHVK